MKFKSLLLASCLGLFSSAYADHSHSYPQNNNTPSTKSELKKGATYPGYCAIEILNYSAGDVTVDGTFEDGVPMESFDIPLDDRWPHKIHLDHYDRRYGYVFCHEGMYISIRGIGGRLLYSDYTFEGETLTVKTKYGSNQPMIEVKKK